LRYLRGGEGTLDCLPGYLLDTDYERDPWAYAEVACFGRVFIDMRGVRAERAEVLRIALLGVEWNGKHDIDAIGHLLRERYGVPVVPLYEVPAWVADNRRHQGPPLDDADLALDLDKLDLWA
jgi:hypothetical protein